jgi:fumarate hydratase subunit alpha
VREVSAAVVKKKVAQLCQQANYELSTEVMAALRKAWETEESPLGKEVLRSLLENARIAREEQIPLCQDCGAAIIFLEIGQEVHIAGGSLYEAVTDGVTQGYTEGYLRNSMVSRPFSARTPLKDIVPPIIHTDITPGDRIKITFLPKGAGAENMTRLGMLKPAEGRQGVVEFVVKAVDEAGGMPCPPLIVGVGIGGTSDKAVLMSKKALVRPLGNPSPDAEVAELEEELLTRINDLGIGPLGLGGRTTALAVHVETYPTHIACMPVAVNFQCHSIRHREVVL